MNEILGGSAGALPVTIIVINGDSEEEKEIEEEVKEND
jgi:hypothetical protein